MDNQSRADGDSGIVEPSKKEANEVENNGSSSNKISFYKLYSFANSTDKALMVIGTIGAIGNGLCMPFMTILFGQLTDAFGQNQNTEHVVTAASQVCLKIVYVAIGVAVAALLQVACWMVTGERQAARIRNLYLKTILRQEIAYFDNETNTGEVVERMSNDTVLIQDAMGEKVGKFIQLMVTFVGSFTVAFSKGSMLTLVLLSCIPVLATVAAIMTITTSRVATKGQIAYRKAAAVVEQTLGSIRTVVSFTGEKQAIVDYNKAMVNAYKSGVQEGVASGMGIGGFMLVNFSTYALGIWYGSRMILAGHYTGGTLMNVIIAIVTGSMSLGQASPCMSAFTAGQVAAFRMFETIKRKPAIDSYDPSGTEMMDIFGEIELQDIYFSYPSRHSEQIFSGFSLSISSGTTAALVGPSGSGKSTVISLIERFYDPDAGQVLIDGINLKAFQLRWIRQKIGLVSQEPVLFSSSIRDNIAYGKAGATIEEILAAAEVANAAKFIQDLPQGLDTLVGEHGTQLSGGQKQRVAIARAILKDPRILLLDEATSALDAESERVVQEALDRIMVNRTTVVVAHRLTTIHNADVIVVIEQGRVVEKGPHSELLKHSDGVYAQLVRSQKMRGESLKPERVAKSHIQSGQRSVSFGTATHAMDRHSSKGTNLATAEILSPSKPPPQVSLRRLAALNKPEIPVLLLGSISAISSGCIYPIFSILFATAITMFYKPPHELRNELKVMALLFLALGVMSLVTYPAQNYFFSVAGCKLVQRIRSKCFEKIVHMEVGWFDDPDNSTGAIGAKLSADSARVRGLVGDALNLLIRNIATTVACLLIAFLANWKLSFIMLGMIPLVGLNGYLQMRFLMGFSADAKKKYEEATQVAIDAVRSIRTVASFCAEENLMQLYEKKAEDPMRTGIKQGLITGVGFGTSFSILFCVYAACFYIAAHLIRRGETTFSEVFRVFLALTLAALGISETSSLAPDSSKAKTAAASLFAILDRKTKIDPNNESVDTLGDVKGEIKFEHVSFTYPTRPNIHIFRDLCLTIPAGKTVALVGESGSGKSTVIALLQRFYDPQSGCITLDGIEIQNFQLKWLRQQMGLVSQEPVLFNDTIRANIAYGKGGDATEAEIIAAAKLANAHKFISSMLQGYDTIVGERGVQLSGGQKQRVTIARAIVKNPKILLLDEATSALDAESERIVQDALDLVMVNRTTVVVAHRLSTIKNADVIAVVKNGVIAEKGDHDSLLSIKDGVYASLVALQTSAHS